MDLLLVVDAEQQIIAEFMPAVNALPKPREIYLGALR
jgi:hypothetical protein